MFFEGIEKKAEIYVFADKFNLLTDCDRSFWYQMADSCGAQVVSSIQGDCCHAFLLSESSLFVWPNKVLIVTCGATELVKAVAYFLDHIDESLIAQLIYQRKNEHVSTVQNSHFFDDICQLDEYIEGKAYRFGQLHDHHNYLYLMENNHAVDCGLAVFQFLVYQLSEQSCLLFNQDDLSGQRVRQYLGLEQLLDGFTIDEHIFNPSGYSLNGIKDDLYFTIHVTPHALASYVSFEANFDFSAFVAPILAVLKPAAFDLLGFNIDDFEAYVGSAKLDSFVSKSLVKSNINPNLMVHFASFTNPQDGFIEAIEVERNQNIQSF